MTPPVGCVGKEQYGTRDRGMFPGLDFRKKSLGPAGS